MFYTKSQLLLQLKDPGSPFYTAIQNQYASIELLATKIKRIQTLLENPELAADQETIVTRCPGRISLSKHADYINNDLLYTLDDRDIYLVAQKISTPKLILINLSEDFGNCQLDLEKLDQVDKSSWTFYPATLYRKLLQKQQGMILVYNSDLPAAGGLSSSHALMLSTAMAVLNLSDQKTPVSSLVKLCQQVENERGFSSGLGDQSAQLLSKKNCFSFIKLFPEPQVEYKSIPNDLAIITAASFIKADKSLPEFQIANKNIQAYKKINELSHKYDCEFLGDLLYKFNEAEIFKILESIQDTSLRGLALYGLAEGARVKELKQHLDTQALGKHLNLSHQAEKCYYRDSQNSNWQSLSETEKLNYKFNPQETIASHSGIYLASTIANDQLQWLANNISGVYGSSISGAGLGGNNVIICDKSQAKAIKEQLIKAYYQERGLAEAAQDKVHISSSSSAAARVI